MSDRKFYVYEHWRPDRGECFYVGKGHGQRAHDMRRGRNRWHKFLTQKLSSMGLVVEVRIIASGLTEEEAFAHEIERIAFWRNDNADLVNVTNGGEGPSGAKHSEEWKRAMSERFKGRKISAEARAKMSAAAMGNTKGLGKKRPQHAVDATAAYWRGRKRSADSVRKMIESKAGRQGRKLSAEEAAKLRLVHLGAKRTEETLVRMRKPKSEEHRLKIATAMTGVRRSEETRAKIAENSRRMWARKRAEKEASMLTIKEGT